MTRRHWIAYVVVAAVLWLGHTVFTRPTLQPTGDFLTFVAAGRGLGTVDIYDDRDMAALWQREFNRPYTNRYIYPPVFAAIVSRVADRDLDALFHDATTVNLALIPVLAMLLGGLIVQRSPRAGPVRGACLVGIALGANIPLLRTLAFTQVNIVVLIAVVVALVAARHSAIAGTALALAASIKIAPALLLAPFAAARRWWALGAFIIVGGTLLAATVAAFGADAWRGFARYTLSHPGMPVAWNTSIDSLVFLSAGVTPVEAETSPLRALVFGLKALVFVATVGLGWRRGFFRTPGDIVDDMLYLLPVMLLVSPYAWPHGHLFVLPTMVVVATRAWVERGSGFRIATALTYGAIFLLPVISTYPWAFVRTAGVAGLAALIATRNPGTSLTSNKLTRS